MPPFSSSISDEDYYTPKQKSLAIIPKCSGFLSFVGSSYIIYDVLSHKKHRSKPYNRLVLGLSICDLLASIVNIMSTWPIPAGTPNVFGAVGNTQTCTAQGFVNETGNVCTPLYNASLCMFFILTICKGWRDNKMSKVEPYLHGVPLLIGLTMGILGLPFDLYNGSGWLCWIAPYPPNCLHDPNVECERGELASLFRWIHYGIIWSAILFVTIGMFIIYWTVWKKESKTRKYTHPSPETIKDMHHPQYPANSSINDSGSAMRSELFSTGEFHLPAVLESTSSLQNLCIDNNNVDGYDDDENIVSDRSGSSSRSSSSSNGIYVVEKEEQEEKEEEIMSPVETTCRTGESEETSATDNSKDVEISEEDYESSEMPVERIHDENDNNSTTSHHHDDNDRSSSSSRRGNTNNNNNIRSSLVSRMRNSMIQIYPSSILYASRHTTTSSSPPRRRSQFSRRRRRASQTRRSRQVAMQAMLFVGALYLTWIFTTLTRIFQIVHGKTYYPLLVLMAIFFPLQGFFNAIIYLRPRYMKLVREKSPEIENKGFFGICWIVLFRNNRSGNGGGGGGGGRGGATAHNHPSRISALTNTETAH